MVTTTRSETSLKPYLALGLALLAFLSVQIARNPVAQQYEISLYDAYSVVFWLAVLALLLLGQYLILRDAIDDVLGHRWQLGATFIVIANALLLLIPYIRYPLYAPGKADMVSFLGMVEYILTTGHFEQVNYYPAAHIVGAALSYFTGLSAEQAVMLVPVILSIFYISALYLLLRELLPYKRALVFALPFFALLLLTADHLQFAPNIAAYSLLPMALFLYFRSRSTFDMRFSALLLLVLFGFVFFHPIITVILGLLLVMIDVSLKLDPRTTVESVFSGDHNATNLTVLLGVLFFYWYYSFEGIVGSTLGVIQQLGGEGEAQAGHVAGVLGRASPELANVVQVGLYKYGTFGIVSLIGGTALGYIMLRRWFGERPARHYEWFFGATFVLFAVLSLGAFFLDLTLSFHRVFRYVLLAGTGLIGIGVFYAFENVRSGRVATLLTVSLLFLVLLLGFMTIFMVYPSPLGHDYNAQITETEQQGMEWTFEYREESLLIDELGTKQYRFYSAINGSSHVGENIRHPDDARPPDHFDYRRMAGPAAEEPGIDEEPRYLVITELGRIEYPYIYPGFEDFWRFTPEDFDQLTRDSSSQQVYDSGGFDVYYIDDQ